MPKPSRPRHLLASDVRPLAQLAIDGVVGATNVAEGVHRRIHRGPLSAFVYGSVRSITRLVGAAIDAAARWLPAHAPAASSPAREATLAALNGVVGDTLAQSGNGLAIPLRWRREEGDDTAPSGRLLLMVHGLCMNHLQWPQPSALARDLGYTPLYLHYNSGLHISTNGRELSQLIEELVSTWPVEVEELSVLAHSMGGLVMRSACHEAASAGAGWPRVLRRIVFLGTPHGGAPLERLGNLVHTALGAVGSTAPFARLATLRSAGITDLRFGSLHDADWQGRDRFASAGTKPRFVALPAGVDCFAVAASTAKQRGGRSADLRGDGLVPVASALGDDTDPARCLAFPADRRWIVYGTTHVGLLASPEVEARVRQWLRPLDFSPSPPPAGNPSPGIR